MLTKLKAIRERANMNKTDLAKIIGVSTNTVYLWEKGKTGIRKIHLAKILDHFKITPEDIL